MRAQFSLKHSESSQSSRERAKVKQKMIFLKELENKNSSLNTLEGAIDFYRFLLVIASWISTKIAPVDSHTIVIVEEGSEGLVPLEYSYLLGRSRSAQGPRRVFAKIQDSREYSAFQEKWESLRTGKEDGLFVVTKSSAHGSLLYRMVHIDYCGARYEIGDLGNKTYTPAQVGGYVKQLIAIQRRRIAAFDTQNHI